MTTGRRSYVPTRDQDQIARLERERDVAIAVAVTAMRTMTDAQLIEMRGALDKDADLKHVTIEVDNHQLSA